MKLLNQRKMSHEFTGAPTAEEIYVLSRILPETFTAHQLKSVGPIMDIWLESEILCANIKRICSLPDDSFVIHLTQTMHSFLHSTKRAEIFFLLETLLSAMKDSAITHQKEDGSSILKCLLDAFNQELSQCILKKRSSGLLINLTHLLEIFLQKARSSKTHIFNTTHLEPAFKGLLTLGMCLKSVEDKALENKAKILTLIKGLATQFENACDSEVHELFLGIDLTKYEL